MTDLNKEDGGGVFGGIFSPMFDSDVQRDAEEMLGSVERTMRSGEADVPREPLLIERLVAELPEATKLLLRGAKRRLEGLFRRATPQSKKPSMSVSPNLAADSFIKRRAETSPVLGDRIAVPPIGSMVEVRVQESIIQAKVIGYGMPCPPDDMLVHFYANGQIWLEAPSRAIIRR